MCLFHSLHSKSNKINASVSRGLVAATQREKFTDCVVLGPQKCYFLSCHLSPESPCKGPHHACKQALPRVLPSGQLIAKDVHLLQQCCP